VGARSFIRPAILLLAATILQGCGGEGGPRREFLSLGTGGTGGVYYPLGGALASRLSLGDSVRQFTAEVTGGSVENVNRIVAGQIDLGFSLAVTAYQAYNGSEAFPAGAEGLRILAPMYANVTHVLVTGSSTAATIADFRGQRVSVGSAGSGTEQISKQLLELHGLAYDDIRPQYLTFSESAAALRDGAIDAAIFSVGYPAAAVLEATTTGDVRLIGIEPERIAALRVDHPYYSVGEIPAGAYPGVEATISTVAMMNWLVADETLSDEVVSGLLNILASDRVSLEQVHEMAEQIDLARLNEAPIPLHATAEAWRSER
jgi:TRAP transporter TAXI family solute receptor